MSKRVTIAVLVVLLTGAALAVDWNRLATAGNRAALAFYEEGYDPDHDREDGTA